MMFDLADLYIKVFDSFTVVFSLLGQVFKHRPWMIPLIPVAGLMLYVSARMRRQGEREPAERRSTPRRIAR